ncbi:hypothetical protein ACI01nite_06040 [Acetobacter cibinongensis]|uniref:Uncharacterized protein n=1 Tax=Acetobacter cibinongensis TaxID=146475 RepID=A0A0D6N409_9PROT|nr:hypothetical protein Abci_011_028 [Acetobacter cibinongensis]GBQ18926.1 hypothetical protein AA0482_2411 [Acetobacter cibinongensis NRIC 0482]GEL58002.1 hypothetical protein ACI01nite_06040 [Acetobacter cibinongensis]
MLHGDNDKSSIYSGWYDPANGNAEGEGGVRHMRHSPGSKPLFRAACPDMYLCPSPVQMKC